MSLHATEYPKIRIPRELRTKYVRKVGEKINLTIPFQVRNQLHLSYVASEAVLQRTKINYTYEWNILKQI